jgi:hypothetical protein
MFDSPELSNQLRGWVMELWGDARYIHAVERWWAALVVLFEHGRPLEKAFLIRVGRTWRSAIKFGFFRCNLLSVIITSKQILHTKRTETDSWKNLNGFFEFRNCFTYTHVSSDFDANLLCMSRIQNDLPAMYSRLLTVRTVLPISACLSILLSPKYLPEGRSV